MCQRCRELEDRIADLEVELGMRQDVREVDRLAKALRLKATAVHLLLCLRDAKGRVVPAWALEQALPKKDRAKEREYDNAKVHVCHIRKALGADAIETSWGRGYRLTPQGEERVKQIVAAYDALQAVRAA